MVRYLASADRQGGHALTWEDVILIARELPEVEQSTSYGTPALKVRGKLLTRLRPELHSVVFFDVALDEKDMLMDVSPGIFHTTPHYDGYPMVLAYLAGLEPDTARPFLARRWRNIAPKRAVAAWDARASSTGPTG